MAYYQAVAYLSSSGGERPGKTILIHSFFSVLIIYAFHIHCKPWAILCPTFLDLKVGHPSQ
jgi:hypothetical protein